MAEEPRGKPKDKPKSGTLFEGSDLELMFPNDFLKNLTYRKDGPYLRLKDGSLVKTNFAIL